MKLCKTTDLKGGEVLARAVLTPEFQVLLSDGITLRPEYIDKMSISSGKIIVKSRFGKFFS